MTSLDTQNPEKKKDSNGAAALREHLENMAVLQKLRQEEIKTAQAFTKAQQEVVKTQQTAAKAEADELKTNVQRIQAEAVTNQLGGGPVTGGDAAFSRLMDAPFTSRSSVPGGSPLSAPEAFSQAQTSLMQELERFKNTRNLRFAGPAGQIFGLPLDIISAPFRAVGLMDEGLGTMAFGEKPPGQVMAQFAMEVMKTVSPVVQTGIIAQERAAGRRVDADAALGKAGIEYKKWLKDYNLRVRKEDRMSDLQEDQKAQLLGIAARLEAALADERDREELGISEENSMIPRQEGSPIAEAFNIDRAGNDPSSLIALSFDEFPEGSNATRQQRIEAGRRAVNEEKNRLAAAFVEQYGADAPRKFSEDVNEYKISVADKFAGSPLRFYAPDAQPGPKILGVFAGGHIKSVQKFQFDMQRRIMEALDKRSTQAKVEPPREEAPLPSVSIQKAPKGVREILEARRKKRGEKSEKEIVKKRVKGVLKDFFGPGAPFGRGKKISPEEREADIREFLAGDRTLVTTKGGLSRITSAYRPLVTVRGATPENIRKDLQILRLAVRAATSTSSERNKASREARKIRPEVANWFTTKASALQIVEAYKVALRDAGVGTEVLGQ